MRDPFEPGMRSSADGVFAKKQHTTPCGDCPMRPNSLPGWFGGSTPEEWLQSVHGEDRINCHVIINKQCAGVATYRANVAKSCRDPDILRLPKDPEKVFATPQDFLIHHKRKFTMKTTENGKQKRGFSAMDPAKVREIASQGGKAAHASGRAHQFTPEEAREAGRKGGMNRNRVGTNKDAEPGAPADPARTPTE